MSSLATYSCASLPGMNQVSKMKADANGYYRVILGGFNLANQSGIPYPLTDSVKALYAKGSVIRRRMETGLCKGEIDHPKLFGMSQEQIIHRLSIIEPTLVSHHIKSMELVDKKDENGKEIVVVYGEVKPSGPYTESLRQSLDNPEENVAFSIRSFCKMTMWKGKLSRIVTDVLTYDHVSEPGIKLANQFDTVCLEAIKETHNFTQADFDRALLVGAQQGLENANETIRMVRDAQGWNKVNIIEPVSFLNW